MDPPENWKFPLSDPKPTPEEQFEAWLAANPPEPRRKPTRRQRIRDNFEFFALTFGYLAVVQGVISFVKWIWPF